MSPKSALPPLPVFARVPRPLTRPFVATAAVAGMALTAVGRLGARVAGGVVGGALELALPARCVACRRLTDEEEPLCPLCAGTVDAITNPCPQCALALPTPGASGPARCLACQLRPPPWSSARAPFAFSGELTAAIRRFKLGPEPLLAMPLGQLLRPSLALSRCDAFVPVPLHTNRLRKREFNQASLLARSARRPHDPPVLEALDRVLDTPPQSTLDARSRHANMRRAFAVRPRFVDEIRGSVICLVDDVLTTGATAAACARVLLAAGAKRVEVLTLARTLP